MIRSRGCRSPHLVVPVLLSLLLLPSCAHRNRNKGVSAPPPIDFLEFMPGSTVQVVIPLTRSGSYVLPSIRTQKPNDFDIHAGDDFIGYEKVVYKVTARRDGGVEVGFTHAADWRNGKRSTVENPKLKLFEDLTAFRYFRLVFLTRESQADHNMAIVAAKNPLTLKELSDAVTNSAQCQTTNDAVCRWVPEGVAVTVDKPR